MRARVSTKVAMRALCLSDMRLKSRVALLLLTAVVVAPFLSSCKGEWGRNRESGGSLLSASQPSKPSDPFTLAVEKVEADRGVPVGKQAMAETPAALKLYKDPRLFLAIQVADAKAHNYPNPHDFAELSELIKHSDQFVEVPTLGKSFILYGVGAVADDELTHFDKAINKSVPLYSDETDLKNALDRLAEEKDGLQKALLENRAELKKLGKQQTDERKLTTQQISKLEKEQKASNDKRSLIETEYKTAAQRKNLFSEFETMWQTAADFGGHSYDLSLTEQRKAFKRRLLSYLRPQALSMIEEISVRYEQRFDRPLPISSLIRTDEYQYELGEAGNPNATRIAIPPHTTGLAFDIYNRYMSREEQEFLMNEIAALEEEGRVEAIRENRDHYHVYVFADGKRPTEEQVRKVLK
jgi:Family of unknown function (DUF5715)